jgi:hypothetical protein
VCDLRVLLWLDSTSNALTRPRSSSLNQNWFPRSVTLGLVPRAHKHSGPRSDVQPIAPELDTFCLEPFGGTSSVSAGFERLLRQNMGSRNKSENDGRGGLAGCVTCGCCYGWTQPPTLSPATRSSSLNQNWFPPLRHPRTCSEGPQTQRPKIKRSAHSNRTGCLLSAAIWGDEQRERWFRKASAAEYGFSEQVRERRERRIGWVCDLRVPPWLNSTSNALTRHTLKQLALPSVHPAPSPSDLFRGPTSTVVRVQTFSP